MAFEIDFADVDTKGVAHGHCPMALLRRDLNGDALTTALFVQDADFAGVRTRYPAMSLKMWELLCHLHALKEEKRHEVEEAYHRQALGSGSA